jgi:hypothetical protein
MFSKYRLHRATDITISSHLILKFITDNIYLNTSYRSQKKKTWKGSYLSINLLNLSVNTTNIRTHYFRWLLTPSMKNSWLRKIIILGTQDREEVAWNKHRKFTSWLPSLPWWTIKQVGQNIGLITLKEGKKINSWKNQWRTFPPIGPKNGPTFFLGALLKSVF